MLVNVTRLTMMIKIMDNQESALVERTFQFKQKGGFFTNTNFTFHNHMMENSDAFVPSFFPFKLA